MGLGNTPVAPARIEGQLPGGVTPEEYLASTGATDFYKSELPTTPRKIDPARAVEAISCWIAQTAKDAPGLVVSLSGTDSLLTYLLCAKAMEIAGRPKDALVGIHFRIEGEKSMFSSAQVEAIRASADPVGKFQVIDLPKNPDLEADIYRWARMQTLALASRSWIVGTRNRTEQELGIYSVASTVAVMQPIIGLYKTEVYELCRYLGVSQDLVIIGQEEECNCKGDGRRVNFSRESDAVDPLLMARSGEISCSVEQSASQRVVDSVRTTLQTYGFKKVIPYTPPVDLLSSSIA